LDVAVITDEGDDDFQFVINLFYQGLLEDHPNINDCNSPNNYTMFLPNDNVPSASVSQLIGLTGDVTDYLSYYFYPNDLLLEPNQNLTIEMIDGNNAFVNTFTTPPTINNIEISNVICACNGLIYLIDDLIWAPGVININEHRKTIFTIDQSLNMINFQSIKEKGTVSIINLNGQIIFTKKLSKESQVKIPKLNQGEYIINYQTKNNNISKLYFFK
tara:strand:- start:3831 stop:4478 length:648 start_codon:yes stop_codon:yes gene_type:complete